MDGTGSARTAAARRRAELDQRIQELHQRNRQFGAFPAGRPAQDRRVTGSSRAQVRRAEELARLASERAIEAIERAATMYLNAATAHERAARMHNLLADNGATGAGEHRSRAREHLQLAAEDRATASAIARGIHG
jgi:phage-related minor tail protein